MTLYKNKYRSESARLPGWDYSTPAFYFITVCTHDRGHLFGTVINGKMVLNTYGRIVEHEWNITGEKNPHIDLDTFQIMPNHFHGIIHIVRRKNHIPTRPQNRTRRDVARNVPTGAVLGTGTGMDTDYGTGTGTNTDGNTIRNDEHPTIYMKMGDISPDAGSLPAIIRSCKSAITKQINERRVTPGARVLQFRYHDHIVRNKQELHRIRHYIKNNPANWEKDRFRRGDMNAVEEQSPEYECELWMV